MKLRSPFAVLALAAASLVLPAAPQKPYPVTTEVRNGTKTVLNPDFPRDGRFTARLAEEMSCGEEGGPEAGILSKPIEFKVDAGGNIYVMDWGDFNIKVYDPAGKFLRAIGREGQGPGEFGMGARFELLKGGKLCVLDGGQSRVSVLASDGRYLGGFLVKGYHRDIAADGQGRIYLSLWAADKEPDSLSTEFKSVAYVTTVFRTDETGRHMVRLVDLRGESVAMRSAGGQGTVAMVGGGGAGVVWDVDPGGRLYGGSNETYSLSAFGPDGKTLFTFGRKFAARKALDVGLPGQGKTRPPFVARFLVFDEQGNLWIELTKTDDTPGVVYDVFSPDGIYLKQVSIAQRISQFLNGKAYSLVRPEDGFPSIKRYGLELVPTER